MNSHIKSKRIISFILSVATILVFAAFAIACGDSSSSDKEYVSPADKARQDQVQDAWDNYKGDS